MQGSWLDFAFDCVTWKIYEWVFRSTAQISETVVVLMLLT